MKILPSVEKPPVVSYSSTPLFVPPSVSAAPGSTASEQLSELNSKSYTPLPSVQQHTPASIAVPFRTPQEIQTAGKHISVSRSGFLWKPVSENNGKLVILLPQSLTGKVQSTSIHSSLPPGSTNMIESGKFSGDTHNGNRAHFRFSKPGDSYPDNAYVVAQLKDGTYTTFQINDSGRRNE